MAVVEARVLAVGGEVDRSGGYAMEFRERGYGGVPPGGYALVPSSFSDWGWKLIHLRPFFSCYAWNRGIFEDTPIEEVHDVEVGANDVLVLAKT